MTGRRTAPPPITRFLATASPTGAQPAPAPLLRLGLPLGVLVAVACLAQFMVVLDSTIVTVALPSMRTALRLSADEQQWVIDSYLIALGGLLMVSAKAGDLYGRKRVFMAGLFVFTAASLVCGLAAGPGLLLAARVVQGAGAAALAPSSLSLITASHPDPARRTKALALWSVMGGSAGAVGVVLGGVLTAELDWRWVFFVNVPIGICLLATAGRILAPRAQAWAGTRLGAESGPALESGPRRRPDLPGALAVTLGTGALTYGVSQATTHGWGSVTVLAPLAAAVLLTGAFVLIEARSASPLVPFSLFKRRSLRVGNVIMLVLGITMTSSLYFVSLYLQQILGYSALRAGLALLPMTVALVGGGFAARLLVPILGARRQLVCGAVAAAAGLAWASTMPAHPAYLSHVLGATVLAGAGISLMLLPITLAATTGIDPRDAGVASGLLNTARQIGGAIGLAALATVASSAAQADAHAGLLGATAHGYRVAILVNAAVALFAGAAALRLPGAARTQSA